VPLVRSGKTQISKGAPILARGDCFGACRHVALVELTPRCSSPYSSNLEAGSMCLFAEAICQDREIARSGGA